jgi:Xaa-Pro aminopeptidase
MYRMLQQTLARTPYADRLVSADRLAVALRGRKVEEEVARIRRAIGVTEDLLIDIERMLRPGVTEREVAEFVHGRVHEAGMEMAWDRRYCPVVNFGPESSFGHAEPGKIALEPGMLVHIDLGVMLDGYCSDLQRMWYVLPDGETDVPREVSRPFEILRRSLDAGFSALLPGVEGWEVDAAARQVLVAADYDEPQFALGHQLGQSTHDGGGLLGPRWPRYGSRPLMPVEEGNIFTIEFALPTPAGSIGLEEDVLVTAHGAEYLSRPQSELRQVR